MTDLRTVAICAGALLVSLTAAPSYAAEPSADDVGASVAHELMQALPIREMIATTFAKESDLGMFTKVRPAWGPLLAQSLADEWVAKQPRIERTLGHTLAVRMSPDELKTGLTIVSDPAVKEGLAASAAHRAPSGPLKARPETERAMASADGKAFLQKMSNAQTIFDEQTSTELLAVVVPGWLRRFGEQAEAAEQGQGTR